MPNGMRKRDDSIEFEEDDAHEIGQTPSPHQSQPTSVVLKNHNSEI